MNPKFLSRMNIAYQLATHLGMRAGGDVALGSSLKDVLNRDPAQYADRKSGLMDHVSSTYGISREAISAREGAMDSGKLTIFGVADLVYRHRRRVA